MSQEPDQDDFANLHPGAESSSHDWRPSLAEPTRASTKRTKRGNFLRLVGISLGLSLLIAALVQLIPSSLFTPPAESPHAQTLSPQKNSPPSTVLQPPRTTSNSSTATMPVDLVAKVHQSVVQIESDDPTGQRIVGTGFVISPQGDIATSYHVAMELGAGLIRFYDGRTFEIAGYRGISKERDLAILRTKLLPSELVPLPLALRGNNGKGTWNNLPVVAAGHPEGVPFLLSQGKINQTLTTNKLSPSAQRFVASLTTSDANPTWLEHTARLSDGSSGGPLLTLQGAVVGINTWVDPQSGYSFALDASALQTLLASLPKAADDSDTPPITPLLDLASPSVKRNYLLWQTSSDTLKQLRETARQFQFSPKSQQQYEQMQRLAMVVTIAQQPELLQADEDHQPSLDELAREADQTLAELEKQKWRDIGFLTLLNEFASQSITRPMSGQFFLATTQRLVEGQGKKAILVKLAGFDDSILLPINANIKVPPPGSQVLILGGNLEGRSIPFGENPLSLQAAHLITPALILPLNP
ncbi:MAG: S1 family peptidase [Planctomycetaceae bacterium]